MTTDLMELADAYAKVGDSADISLIKHHRSALKSALEELGREVAELKAGVALAVEQAETLIKQRDQARAELAAIRAQEPVAIVDKRIPGNVRWGEWSSLQDGSNLYAFPATKDAGLVAALKDAATSLETISRLAGHTHYVGDDGERVETYMGRHDEVRGYATSRASKARAALSKLGGV